MKSILTILSLCCFTLLFVACSGGPDNSVDSIMGRVSDDMIPASLHYGLTQDSVFINAGSDPCEEYQSEYGSGTIGACQPKLLRSYLNMAKLFLDSTKIMVEDIGDELGDVPDGQSGTVTLFDGQIATYSKTDASHYKVLVKKGSVPSVYLVVSGTQITIKMDFDVEGGSPFDEGGKFSGFIDYEDDDNYNVTLDVLDMSCKTDDVGAPRNIRVFLDKEFGMWDGVAMLYHPRWGGSYKSLTCNSTETDNTGVLMYSNFVGDETASKVNTYIMKRTITNAAFDASLQNYGINRMCTNYSDILGSGGCTNAGAKMASFVNSFCNPADTLEAIWNDDCVDFDFDVADESFPEGHLWVYPSEFYNIEDEFSIPSTL